MTLSHLLAVVNFLIFRKDNFLRKERLVNWLHALALCFKINLAFLSDKLAGELIAAYNRGFEDGYECGLKDWHLYEQDMKKMREEEERG